MKRTLLVVAAVLSFSWSASATLIDRVNGLIYDDVLDITWLQDAGYIFTSGYLENGERMNWNEAMAWADALEYGGFDNWRLPTAFIEINVSEVSNYWPAATEMGHLYLVDLNNVNIGSTLNTGQFPESHAWRILAIHAIDRCPSASARGSCICI